MLKIPGIFYLIFLIFFIRGIFDGEFDVDCEWVLMENMELNVSGIFFRIVAIFGSIQSDFWDLLIVPNDLIDGDN
jgi:hypothetical protein